jgi:hypothetical protein
MQTVLHLYSFYLKMFLFGISPLFASTILTAVVHSAHKWTKSIGLLKDPYFYGFTEYVHCL